MGFFKKDNIYRITRITGSQDNILGVVFDNKNNSDNNIEVIKWDFPKIDKSRIRTSKEEVLEQVLSGLESVNQSLGTNFKSKKLDWTVFDLDSTNLGRIDVCYDRKLNSTDRYPHLFLENTIT